jgi:hypothetical protein
MTVAELIEKLVKLQMLGAEVVTPAYDHGYRKLGRPNSGLAEVIGRSLYEYYSEEYKSHPDNKVIDVVVIE